MSSEIKDRPSGLPELQVEIVQESRKVPRFSYTRDFLLSLSELDICKKLPEGCNRSTLSELEDASNGALEQQRSLGGSYFQSSKRIEYGPVQSNRVESSGNYSRGSHGRWDTRSSGSSDREELQADRESVTQDYGRRYANQPRRPWQQSEHDGLLGRPSGYSGQPSAQRARGDGSYQLSKSNEPYQPPRPYKAVPFSRNNTDSYNDETFGSSEFSSEDRAEEEMRRRASFELMRKEQQKALQEKQKPLPDKHSKDLDTDIISLLENSEDAQSVRNKNNDKSEDNVVPTVLQNDSSRLALHMQAPSSRPNVPPGFGKTVGEKKLGTLLSSTSLASEAGPTVSDEIPLLPKDTLATIDINTILKKGRQSSLVHTNEQNSDSINVSIPFINANEEAGASSLDLEVSGSSTSYLSHDSSGVPESFEVQKDGILGDYTDKEVVKVTETISKDHSTSILDKLFQNALTINDGGSSDFIERQTVKGDDETRSPSSSLSSKFAHWFHEEKKKPIEDFSSGDLLSLIVSNDKVGCPPPSIAGEKAIENIPSELPLENNDTAEKFFMSTVKSSIANTPELYDPADKPENSSGVLTCEDLEQSILAEVNVKSSSMSHSVPEPWSVPDAKSGPRKADVDDHASQHLLSLLQRGTNSNDSAAFFNLSTRGSSERFDVSNTKTNNAASVSDNVSAGSSEIVQNAEQSLTLEALFGTAFMKELQSVEAPVSAQRGSVSGGVKTNVQHPHGLPFSHTVDSVNGLFSSIPRRYDSHAINETSMPENHNQDAKLLQDHEPWHAPEASRTECSKPSHALGFDGGTAEILLPEEESLIAVGDAVNPTRSEIFPIENAVKSQEVLPLKAQDNFDQLAVLQSIIGHERISSLAAVGGPHPVRGPYDRIESDRLYHQLLGRPSSQQFPPHHQLSQTRPLFQQLDSHAPVNPDMKFVGPDNIHHAYPANMIHHNSLHSPGGSRFDPASQLQMLQHMQMPGNFPPRQLHGYPRGVPPSHPFNHMPPFIPEMNPMHGFPLNHRQPGYGGIRMGVPGPAVGGGISHPETIENLMEMERRASLKQNHTVPGGPAIGGGISHPETIENLMEMERRASLKQNHPVPGAPVPSIYSPEIDMGFRYG